MNRTVAFGFGFAYVSLMSAYMIKTQLDFREKQRQTRERIEELRTKLNNRNYE